MFRERARCAERCFVIRVMILICFPRPFPGVLPKVTPGTLRAGTFLFLRLSPTVRCPFVVVAPTCTAWYQTHPTPAPSTPLFEAHLHVATQQHAMHVLVAHGTPLEPRAVFRGEHLVIRFDVGCPCRNRARWMNTWPTRLPRLELTLTGSVSYVSHETPGAKHANAVGAVVSRDTRCGGRAGPSDERQLVVAF